MWNIENKRLFKFQRVNCYSTHDLFLQIIMVLENNLSLHPSCKLEKQVLIRLINTGGKGSDLSPISTCIELLAVTFELINIAV